MSGAIFIGSSIIETREFFQGKISPGLYAYHIGGGVATWGISIGVGALYGGPWGATAGFCVGGVLYTGEVMYDKGKELHNVSYQHVSSWVNSVRTGAIIY